MIKKRNVSGCNIKAVCYSHFVWQPGVRRQRDFKRDFRPDEDDEEEQMSIISTEMLSN